MAERMRFKIEMFGRVMFGRVVKSQSLQLFYYSKSLPEW